MSFPSLLCLILIVLKLLNLIAISWLWALSPLWIMLLLGIAFFVLATVVGTPRYGFR